MPKLARTAASRSGIRCWTWQMHCCDKPTPRHRDGRHTRLLVLDKPVERRAIEDELLRPAGAHCHAKLPGYARHSGRDFRPLGYQGWGPECGYPEPAKWRIRVGSTCVVIV